MQVVPNPGVLEYEAWATIGINVKNQFAHKVIDEIIKNPAVYCASMCIGRFNVLLGARFHNVDLVNLFTKVELPRIQGVDSVQTFLLNRPLKYHGIDWSHMLNPLSSQ